MWLKFPWRSYCSLWAVGLPSFHWLAAYLVDIQYRSKVSWHYLETWYSKLDSRSSILENFKQSKVRGWWKSKSQAKNKSKADFCDDEKKSLAESDKGSWHDQLKEEWKLLDLINEKYRYKYKVEPVPSTSENFSDSDDSRSSSEDNNAWSIMDRTAKTVWPFFFIYFSFPHF